MSSTVQELVGLVEVEKEAEERIKEAKQRAEEILRRAREEADRILMLEQESTEIYTYTKEFEEKKRRMEEEQREKIKILNRMAEKNLDEAVRLIIQEVMGLNV
ncbi:MAG: hypothetical protein ACUVTM_03555 [Candidatus Bathyarchaeia archaeon]